MEKGYVQHLTINLSSCIESNWPLTFIFTKSKTDNMCLRQAAVYTDIRNDMFSFASR